MTTTTWTDWRGTQRSGTLLEAVSGEHAQFGPMHGYLYRVPASDTNAQYLTLEITAKGRTSEYRMASEDEGRRRVGQMRGQLV